MRVTDGKSGLVSKVDTVTVARRKSVRKVDTVTVSDPNLFSIVMPNGVRVEGVNLVHLLQLVPGLGSRQ